MKPETAVKVEYFLTLAIVAVMALCIILLSGCSYREDPCRSYEPLIGQYVYHCRDGCPAEKYP